MKTLIIIPSRLSAVRLPGKPLLKINGLSIISHVFKKAEEANIGEVFVAAEDQEIIDDVLKNGGQAILTGAKHKTGTDRVFEALEKLLCIQMALFLFQSSLHVPTTYEGQIHIFYQMVNCIFCKKNHST